MGEKVVDRVTTFEVIEQRLHRNAGAGEAWRAMHDVWISGNRVHDCTDGILPPVSECIERDELGAGLGGGWGWGGATGAGAAAAEAAFAALEGGVGLAGDDGEACGDGGED